MNRSTKRQEQFKKEKIQNNDKIGLRFQKTLKHIENFSLEELREAFNAKLIKDYPVGAYDLLPQTIKASKTDILAIQTEWAQRKHKAQSEMVEVNKSEE